MTREQKLYKGLIRADLRIVSEFYNSEDKALRLQAPSFVRLLMV